jgi:2-phosphoglycerate kinase
MNQKVESIITGMNSYLERSIANGIKAILVVFALIWILP